MTQNDIYINPFLIIPIKSDVKGKKEVKNYLNVLGFEEFINSVIVHVKDNNQDTFMYYSYVIKIEDYPYYPNNDYNKQIGGITDTTEYLTKNLIYWSFYGEFQIKFNDYLNLLYNIFGEWDQIEKIIPINEESFKRTIDCFGKNYNDWLNEDYSKLNFVKIENYNSNGKPHTSGTRIFNNNERQNYSEKYDFLFGNLKNKFNVLNSNIRSLNIYDNIRKKVELFIINNLKFKYPIQMNDINSIENIDEIEDNQRELMRYDPNNFLENINIKMENISNELFDIFQFGRENGDLEIFFNNMRLTCNDWYKGKQDIITSQNEKFLNPEYTFFDYLRDEIYKYFAIVEPFVYYSTYGEKDQNQLKGSCLPFYKINKIPKSVLINKLSFICIKVEKKEKKVNGKITDDRKEIFGDFLLNEVKYIKNYIGLKIDPFTLYKEVNCFEKINLFIPASIIPLNEEELIIARNKVHREIHREKKLNWPRLYKYLAKRYYVNLFNYKTIFNYNDLKNAIKLLRAHVFYVLCGGFPDRYKLVANFFIHLLKFPGTVLQVMLWFYGGGGAGKTMLFEGLKKHVFGNQMIIFSSSMDRLSSRFNGLFNEGKTIVVLEEISIPKRTDISSTNIRNKLKTGITNNTTEVEKKGVDAIESKNFVNYIATSNDVEECITFKDHSEYRRHQTLLVNNQFTNDPLMQQYYFGNLFPIIDSDALIYFIDLWTITEYDPNYNFSIDIPSILPLKQQKMESISENRPPAITFWREIINSGTNYSNANDYLNFKSNDNNYKIYNPINFGIDLKKLLLDINKKNRKEINNDGEKTVIRINSKINDFYNEIDNYDYDGNWKKKTNISNETIKNFNKKLNQGKKDKENDISSDQEFKKKRKELESGLIDLLMDFRGKIWVDILTSTSQIIWPSFELTYLLLDEKFGRYSRLPNLLGFYGSIKVMESKKIKKNITYLSTNIKSFYYNSDIIDDISIPIFNTDIINYWYNAYEKLYPKQQNESFLSDITNENFNEYLQKIFFLMFLVRCLPIDIPKESDLNVIDKLSRYKFFINQIKKRLFDYCYISNNDYEFKLKIIKEEKYVNDFFEFIEDDNIGPHLLECRNTIKKRKKNNGEYI